MERTMRITMSVLGSTLAITLLFAGGVQDRNSAARAQSAPAAGRQIGTVKAVSGSSLTLATDGGSQVSVSVADGARILQLAPGSTDLKSAQQISLSDIAVGDRVLVTGKMADDGSLAAMRIILMKSSDIAQKNAAERADWQKRGAGGIVEAVSGTAITISSGRRKIQIETSPSTVFRRYGADSVKFEDAKPGTLDQIKPGDQLRVRGNKSEDGSTIQAQEVVSGAFKNLAGTLASVSASEGTVTLKDLATKKNVTVAVTSNSDIRKLPPEMAARFAARAKGGEVGGSGAPAAGPRTAAGGEGGTGAGTRSAGGDLSQMLSRLPTEPLSDLKVGDAVMIVASEPSPESEKLTAVTMLSGVEPILAATPKGSAAMTLSPWNMGGGGAVEGGEGAGGPQ
jgi:co-chaperonin GroES (HSP10)